MVVKSSILMLLIVASFAALIHAGLLDTFVLKEPAFVKYEMLPDSDLSGEGKVDNAGLSWTAKAVNLTSQAWMTTDDWGADWGGENAQWWHYMYIITPSVIKSEGWNSMYITDGKNSDAAPAAYDENIAVISELAMHTGQIQVVLFQVPNYPLYLKNPDGTQTASLGDDALLANTFVHYMDYIKNGGDPDSLDDASWVVLLPMVKSAFAAMAAVEDIYSAKVGEIKWTVSGASKRGWTTWLVGAVDAMLPTEQRRVRGIVPIVLNGLNFEGTLKHQYQVYGGWSFAMHPFVDVGFTGRIDSEEIKPLWALIDPYTYLERLKELPLLVNSMVGDEFFVIDSSRYWYDDLVATGSTEFSVATFPDAEHSCATALPSMIPSIGAFETNLAHGRKSPRVSHTLDYSSGTITLQVDPAFKDLPRTVELWESHTCMAEKPRRDFRMINLDLATLGECSCGPKINDQQCFNLRTGIWANTTLAADTMSSSSGANGDGLTYTVTKKAPPAAERRWEGFFIQVTFHGASPEYPNKAAALGGGGSSCEEHVIGGRKHCLPVTSPGDFVVSSNVMVLPDYSPYDCSGEDCLGTIL
jgi:PhoPQ-activated pathogenicity-related protein